MPDKPKKEDVQRTATSKKLSEQEILHLLETARQNVKQMAKRALEGETITADLLKTRLKSL